MDGNEKIEVEIKPATEADVPALIQSQFLKMNDYKSNLEVARKKAEEARLRIEATSGQKLGLLKYKSTIEGIQETQMYLSEATLQNTEAQEKSFEYQQALAEITKYLFGLGVTSITMNRTVVRELEMKLSHASEEELDEMERDEITNLIRELKGQEDIMKKQSDMLLKMKNQEERITSLEEANFSLKTELLQEKKENEVLKGELSTSRGTFLKKDKNNKIFISLLAVTCIVLFVLVLISLLK